MKKPLILLALLCASCAKNPATGGYMFTLASREDEVLIGMISADGVLKGEGLYRPQSEVTKYVNSLCNRIYAVTEAAADPMQCNFIDTNEVNASATPGYMLINRGLLPFLSSEAELASVLGHESGHNTSRHTLQKITYTKASQFLVSGLAIAAATQTTNYVTLEALTQTGNQAAQVGRMTYSREKEREADALGRRYMASAGYDARESVNAERQLLGYEKYALQQAKAFNNGEEADESLFSGLLATHPQSHERLETAIREAGEPAPFSLGEDPAGRKRYMAAIQGLTYGPARRYGILRKGELVLTKQRLVLPMPNGLTADYLPSGNYKQLGVWLLAHPQSGTSMQLTSIRKVQTGHSPGAWLEKLLPALSSDIQRIRMGQGEKSTIGYTATYRYLMDDRRYRLIAVAPPPPVNEMVIIRIAYPNEQVQTREEGNLLTILQSLRPLTKDEADKYKQLELHTFTAAGESVKMRAEKLPVSGLQEELFRAMNNLPSGTEMTPGQTYKTILDPNQPGL